ncbi:uncharacterized protein LOC120630971 [Pararge aegeria]|nr:uncharacterized protein LOC120630971 [Pararge aegeria]
MEAQKLKKKKNAISKGKLKKTIKNVISRPDPVFWPAVTEAEETILQNALEKLRVHIPEFKKPHWNDIKLLPKKERPQPQHIQKVEGLLFGISECYYAVKTQNCSAVIIEANVNPQNIVHPIIEACVSSNISVLCLNDLREYSLTYFGVKTTCLGIKKDYLQDLSDKICETFKNYKPNKKSMPIRTTCSSFAVIKEEDSQMDIEAYCPYVYRSDKKTRAFVTNDTQQDTKVTSQFTGQHFIKLQDNIKPENDRKAYMRMMVKKISNNPNRVTKAKHKS